MQIIDFIGGLCTVMLSFLVPVFDYANTFKGDEYSVKRTFGYMIFVVFAIAGIAATGKSIYDFFQKKEE